MLLWQKVPPFLPGLWQNVLSETILPSFSCLHSSHTVTYCPCVTYNQSFHISTFLGVIFTQQARSNMKMGVSNIPPPPPPAAHFSSYFRQLLSASWCLLFLLPVIFVFKATYPCLRICTCSIPLVVFIWIKIKNIQQQQWQGILRHNPFVPFKTVGALSLAH